MIDTYISRLRALIGRIDEWEALEDAHPAEAEEVLMDIRQCLESIVRAHEAEGAVVVATEQGVCEVVRGEPPHPMERTCERPATMRYPAKCGGYMRLCDEHGAKHAAYCERWDGQQWRKGRGSK